MADTPEIDLSNLEDDSPSSMLIEDYSLLLIEQIYQLWWRWADFTLYIVDPVIAGISPPVKIDPEIIPGTSTLEHVYTIYDFGNKFSTSKAEDMYSAGMSMCKMHYTIEKIIFLLIERLKLEGTGMEDEVQIAFAGHELTQRKAFESVINLPYNVIVNNFDPGAWGENYLQTVKRIADKGYGYPSETPRIGFRQEHGSTSGGLSKF